MTTKVQQWGNSLALRIPRSYAKDIHLAKGATVDLSVSHGQLVIKPSKPVRYSLAELLKGISKDNLHAEVRTGRPAGSESW